MSHAPGPWEWLPSDEVSEDCERLVVKGSHETVVMDLGNRQTYYNSCGYISNDQGQAEANMALIAAAPDLIKALEALERTAGIACASDDPVRIAARAAIAKAKGVTS